MTTTEIKAYLSAQGRKGGLSKSPAKAAASRQNGAKGGRKPKKIVSVGIEEIKTYLKNEALDKEP